MVEISAAGWKIIESTVDNTDGAAAAGEPAQANAPPVRFRRTKSMVSLPAPERGGSLDMLRRLVNIDDADWPLAVAWLVAALRPRGPYPTLALFATQGAGKTFTAKCLRALIDPNTSPLRCEPRDKQDLAIMANASWCVAYDNLSHLPAWLSDALCRLATGAVFQRGSFGRMTTK